MPDVLVEVRGSWLGARKPRFLEAIHAALVDAIRIPRDDKVQPSSGISSPSACPAPTSRSCSSRCRRRIGASAAATPPQTSTSLRGQGLTRHAPLLALLAFRASWFERAQLRRPGAAVAVPSDTARQMAGLLGYSSNRAF